MAWAVLVFSGMMESVWAIALDKSEGFSHVGPSIVFVLGLLLSMGGLAFALKTLPVGTAYAVWVGIGASLTVVYGMVTGIEPVSAAKIALLVGLIACIVGLKLVGGESGGLGAN